MDLGQINLLIGDNGSGKTNILEAFTLGSAAAQGKLDEESLIHRGMRVTEPRFMCSAFDQQNPLPEIQITFEGVSGAQTYKLTAENKPYASWIDLNDNFRHTSSAHLKERALDLASEMQLLRSMRDKKDTATEIWGLVDAWIQEQKKIKQESTFLIYQAAERILYHLTKVKTIEPLGIYGEGLYEVLQDFSVNKPENLKKIQECLAFVDWFDEIALGPDKNWKQIIQVKDVYTNHLKGAFTQQSMPQGFLSMLFYIAIFLSDETPHLFAIDNIDQTIDSKSAACCIRSLIHLSELHEKQVILTARNPGILDGLDLSIPTQKLFIIKRDMEGKTYALPIRGNTCSENRERLSEAYLSGQLESMASQS